MLFTNAVSLLRWLSLATPAYGMPRSLWRCSETVPGFQRYHDVACGQRTGGCRHLIGNMLTVTGACVCPTMLRLNTDEVQVNTDYLMRRIKR